MFLSQSIHFFPQAFRSRGVVVSKEAAVADVERLIQRFLENQVGPIGLRSSYWTQNLFQRMDFRRRAATTGKIEVPDAVKEEIGLPFYFDIIQKLTRHNIPPSLTMNLDQRPSNIVPGRKATQAKIGSTTVPTACSTEKKATTLTFAITLNRAFLPIQTIYEGKTTRHLAQVKFLEPFCLSFNEKHWGNEKESLKIIEEIIGPYVTKERPKLSSSNQATLLIMDVFKGQMTNPVLKKLEEHNILLTRVPKNITHLFQPLELTINGYFKQFMKRKLVEWYANKLIRVLDDGQDLESIMNDFKLSTVKPLLAKLIMEAYDHLKSSRGKDICLKGWEKRGIQEALENGFED